MKEVLLSQALIPPGQVTSCGSILKTTRDHKYTAKEVRVDVAQQWNKHSSTHKAVVPTTDADTWTCAYKLTQAYMHTHTHSNSSSDIAEHLTINIYDSFFPALLLTESGAG